MTRSFDLWITNCLTNEIEICHDFSDIFYSLDKDLMSRYIFVKIKPYLDDQIPIKLELIYK